MACVITLLVLMFMVPRPLQCMGCKFFAQVHAPRIGISRSVLSCLSAGGVTLACQCCLHSIWPLPIAACNKVNEPC